MATAAQLRAMCDWSGFLSSEPLACYCATNLAGAANGTSAPARWPSAGMTEMWIIHSFRRLTTIQCENGAPHKAITSMLALLCLRRLRCAGRLKTIECAPARAPFIVGAFCGRLHDVCRIMGD